MTEAVKLTKRSYVTFIQIKHAVSLIMSRCKNTHSLQGRHKKIGIWSLRDGWFICQAFLRCVWIWTWLKCTFFNDCITLIWQVMVNVIEIIFAQLTASKEIHQDKLPKKIKELQFTSIWKRACAAPLGHSWVSLSKVSVTKRFSFQETLPVLLHTSQLRGTALHPHR